MNIIKKLALKVIPKVQEFEYQNIYSSRKVVKNQWEDNKPAHYYSEDIWGVVNSELKEHLIKGLTIYGECVGYLKEGKLIQKPFDYGCATNEHRNYIYRITSTNEDGIVFEWSMKQVQDFCKEKGLNAVPLRYYGTVKDYIGAYCDDDDWRIMFSQMLTEEFLEKDCTICKNKVPAEGICIRKEVNDIDVFKLKSSAFRIFETKMLDGGIENIEDSQDNIE